MDKRFLTRESIKSIVKINLEHIGVDCGEFDDSLLLKQQLKVTKYNLYYLINFMHHTYKIVVSTDEVLKQKNVGELVDYFCHLIIPKKDVEKSHQTQKEKKTDYED